ATRAARLARRTSSPRSSCTDSLHAAQRELDDVPRQIRPEARGIRLPALAMQDQRHLEPVENRLRHDTDRAALDPSPAETWYEPRHDLLRLAHDGINELGDDHRQRLAGIGHLPLH